MSYNYLLLQIISRSSKIFFKLKTSSEGTARQTQTQLLSKNFSNPRHPAYEMPQVLIYDKYQLHQKYFSLYRSNGLAQN